MTRNRSEFDANAALRASARNVGPACRRMPPRRVRRVYGARPWLWRTLAAAALILATFEAMP